MNIGQWIVIALCAILLVWYLAASQFNRRRGLATYRWLRRGLEQVGDRIEAQWLGSSSTGAKLVIPKAEKPYRRVEVMYLLETREILPYWLLSHLRGRRDELVINATLRQVPKIEVRVERTAQPQEIGQLPPDQPQPHQELPVPVGFTITQNGPGDPGSEQRLSAFLGEVGEPLESLVLQSGTPHLEIKLQVKTLLATPPDSFFAMLRSWLQSPGG
jgi:hypothetical protein